MKKIIMLFLVGVMGVSVVACGNTNKSTTIETKPQESNREEMNKVIVDNDYVTLTIQEKYEKTESGKTEIGYLLLGENKTDKKISISFEDVSVDGFAVDTGVRTDGTAGSAQSIDAGMKVYFRWAFFSEQVVNSKDDLKNVSAIVEIQKAIKESGNSTYYSTVDEIELSLE